MHTDQSFTVDGSLEYSSLAQQIDLPMQDDESDFHTVAGLIMDELQAIPDVDDSVDYHQWRFTVIEKVGQRMKPGQSHPAFPMRSGSRGLRWKQSNKLLY